MKSIFAVRFVLAALTLATAVSASASDVSLVHEMTAVARSQSGAAIVKADGGLYIQLQPSAATTRTAQEIYEKSRAQFRALMDQTAADESADKGYSPVPARTGLMKDKAFYGFSLPSGKKVTGVRYLPSREERLENPSAREYIIAQTDSKQGVVATGMCRNPQGTPDVVGLNYGHSGCAAQIKIFRRL